MSYYEQFRKHVIEALGGHDMAREFFDLHPSFIRSMVRAADYHQKKGGSPQNGAEAFTRFVVKPRLQKDRRIAGAL